MRLFSILCIAIVKFATSVSAEPETHTYPTVLSMQERASLQDAWLKKRLDTIAPMVMRERGVDMWILIAREYNEDPVVKTMLPSTWLSARRRTILVFHDTGKNVDRFAVSRYAVGDFFEAAWNPEKEPDQWKRLAEIISEKAPEKIAINVSDTFALADGMSHSQYRGLMNALEAKWTDRIVEDPAMAIGWLERRIPEEMEHYDDIVGLAHAIIQEGLSNKAIQPNVTTTADLSWWFRDKIREHRVTAWFHPTVSIQRHAPKSADQKMTELFDPDKDSVVRPGDLIHLDFGITYMGLNTDTQHHAYILRDDETDAPEGLKKALKNGNRLQDILTNGYRSGKSGDQLLAETRAKAISEGINPSIYTHPIGYHGHGAGATIGMWDQQNGVKGRGYYPIVANTAWSIELNATTKIPEWDNQNVRIMLEEDAYFDGVSVRYIDGRQTKFHLVGAEPNDKISHNAPDIKRTSMWVSDLNEAIKFFRDVIGFTIESEKKLSLSPDSVLFEVFNADPAQDYRRVIFSSKTEERILFVMESAEAPTLGSADKRPSILVIRTDDIGALTERARENGFQVGRSNTTIYPNGVGQITETVIIGPNGHAVLAYEIG